MLLVNFKSWTNFTIIASLIVISLVFAFLIPPSQKSKNISLYEAVIENNTTKVEQLIANGAQVTLLLPSGFPLISLAIENENEKMLSLLMLKPEALVKSYKGYRIIDHAAQKKNKKLLEMIIQVLERRKK